LLVFFLHLAVWEKTFGIARPLLGSFIWYGYAGVDLFFVLSGFLITYTQYANIGQPSAVVGYVFRRAWRIYPTFWAMMLIGVGVFVGMHGHWAFTTDPEAPGYRTLWLTWLTLAPGRIPNLYDPPAWSLSYEMMFYLAFATLIVLPRRVGPWLLAGWGIGVGLAAWWFGANAFPKNAWLTHLLSPFVWEFLLGCTAAWIIRLRYVGYGGLCTLLGIGWAAVGVLMSADPKSPADVAGNQIWRAGVFGPASALVVYGLVTLEIQGRFTLPTVLRRFGDASYSIYLLHSPACGVVFELTLSWSHTFFTHLVWLWLMMLAGVGGGFVLYGLVERPLLKLVQRRKAKQSEPAPQVINERIPWGQFSLLEAEREGQGVRS
jgi:peptidoglycan/LPS O-acetylase OafA/YrhL